MQLPQDKTKWAYLAALIDGEGTISIGGHSAKLKSGELRPRFDLQINVANTDIRLMKWLTSVFGFNYYTLSQNKNIRSRKPCYQWKVSGRKSQEQFLLAVIPYLVMKKEQAKLALEFLRLPYDSASQRFELKKRMSELNGNKHLCRVNYPSPVSESVTTNTSSLPSGSDDRV